MLRTKAQMVAREKAKVKKRARKFKRLAGQPKARPLSILVREKRKHELRTIISRSGMAKVNDNVVTDDEDVGLGSEDTGDPGVGKAVRITATDGKVRIHVGKFVPLCLFMDSTNCPSVRVTAVRGQV